MRVIEPSFHIETDLALLSMYMLGQIEKAGRTCYKSEAAITPDSCLKFVEMIIKNGHHSVLEHQSITVRIICDRGVSHEIVRHRIAAYSQESTRYCNYTQDKFHNEITFIKPFFWKEDSAQYLVWETLMRNAELAYNTLIKGGATPQEARSVLPNSLKTEIVCTYNLREWRHFFTLRTSKAAHPQMREITIPMLEKFKILVPIVFDDIEVNK